MCPIAVTPEPRARYHPQLTTSTRQIGTSGVLKSLRAESTSAPDCPRCAHRAINANRARTTRRPATDRRLGLASGGQQSSGESSVRQCLRNGVCRRLISEHDRVHVDRRGCEAGVTETITHRCERDTRIGQFGAVVVAKIVQTAVHSHVSAAVSRTRRSTGRGSMRPNRRPRARRRTRR